MSLFPPRVTRSLAAAALVAAAATAQQVKVAVAPGAVVPVPIAGQAGGDGAEDPGTTVEMFENPNLDRYLRKAQSFLEREDYPAAIQVLQDVIDGKTVEVLAGPGEEVGAPAGSPSVPAASPSPSPANAANPASSAAGEPAAAPGRQGFNRLDARNSVFSADGRLFRPVSRLCHELLARLPTIGIDLYRATYEVAAEELLQQAERDGSVAALEAVANRYFVTLPAGRAMAQLADRLMHEGRYRSAVMVLRDLGELYPAPNRKQLGISEVWCRFKIALCLRLAGERDAAHAAVVELAAANSEDSLRIQGELESVRDMPSSHLFTRDVEPVGHAAAATTGWLADEVEALVPLWQVRFRNPEPYRDPKPSNDRNNVFWSEGSSASRMPFASRYGPATRVVLEPGDSQGLPRALFLEHYRLRQADAATGVLLAEGDGVDNPPPPRENQPRVRIAAADFALLRPVHDDARDYVVLGHAKDTTNSVEVFKASTLVAYRRGTLERAWSSEQWLDGDAGLRDVTFLAAPTVFGERLLLPSLRRGAYTLECLDRRSGRPMWNTPLHAGGSGFFKAPGCPVVVQAGVAFVASNAGCVAAVDAFAGDLRWIRRYERRDPRRPPPKRRAMSQEERFGYVQQFAQGELEGFLPNDLVLQGGLLVTAPIDSDMLLCLDAASGAPVWWLDGTMQYAAYGKLRLLIGTDGEDLFALSDTHLVGIGLAGGLVKWAKELPQLNGPKAWTRGRGTIVGDRVLVPGDRELLVFDARGVLPMRRLPLPAFDASRDPLGGSFDITSVGPWLALGFQGGVEMVSSRRGLLELAATIADPLRQAELVVAAGDRARGEALLAAALRDGELAADVRTRLAGQLLGLVGERAERIAAAGDITAALRALDDITTLIDEPTRLGWLLARVELCRNAGALREHELAQQRLYDHMEGKG